MGTLYKCSCNVCTLNFDVYDGDGMRAIGLICDTCGHRSSIPRKAPRPPREGREVPSFLQTSRFYSLPPIPDADIKRFTGEELANIDQLFKSLSTESTDIWDDFEIAALVSHKNPCQCCGRIDLASKTAIPDGPNTMTRCPACHSNELTATATGAWD